MLTHVLKTNILFRSFRKRSTTSVASDLPESIDSSQNHFTLNSESTDWAPPSRAIPKWHPHAGGITIRSFLQFLIPYFIRRFPVMVIEISAYNHAASPHPRWRRTTPMRSRWTIIKFSACNLNHGIINRDRYNISTCEDRAAAQIPRTPYPPPTT